jgi:LysM repeat protein
MKPVVLLLIGFLCFTGIHIKAENHSRTDSLGVATIEGKSFIRHKVDPGESLSVIARRYGVSVTEIQKANKISGTGIKAGEVLMVPMLQPAKAAAPTKAGTTMQRIVHTVSKGETLFAIAKKYGTSVEQIRALNRIDSDALAVGQELVISDAAGKAATPPTKVVETRAEPKSGTPAAPKPSETPADPHPAADSRPNTKTGISTTSSEHKTGSLVDMMADMTRSQQDSVFQNNVFPEVEVLTSEKVVTLPPAAKKKSYVDPYSSKKYLQVEEEGTAGFISDYSTDQTKFYAFHKYLPVGSYLRIDYPAKNQSILVEVISNLDAKSEHVVLLSAKCGHYLSLWKEGEKVRLRYVVPDPN